MKEQHEGKNILSPERKIARTENEEKEEKPVESGTGTTTKEELENLQDILVQTGKDKEELAIKLAEGNKIIQKLEKENSKLDQENKYLKTENQKCIENTQKLDIEYQNQSVNMKKNNEEKDNVIKILKDQLVRQGAVPSLMGPGGISSPKPPLASAAAAPRPTAAPRSTTAPRSNAAPPDVSPVATLDTPQDTSLPAHGSNHQPDLQDTSLQGATREVLENDAGQQPGDPLDQVDECVENFSCDGNCEHIGCHIKLCEECNFKTNSESRLESHIKEKHGITCFTCKNTFRSFSDMIEHRKIQHPSTKKCSNFPNCERGESCLYIHEGTTNNLNTVVTQENLRQVTDGAVICRICLSEFHDKNEMMIHRKNEHIDKVGMCKNISAGLNCRKGPVHCWYNHIKKDAITGATLRPTSQNPTSVPAFTEENFPYRLTPRGAVVGQGNIDLQMIHQTLLTQQQAMTVMMDEIMKLKN